MVHRKYMVSIGNIQIYVNVYIYMCIYICISIYILQQEESLRLLKV